MKAAFFLVVCVGFCQGVRSVDNDELIVATTSGIVEGVRTEVADGRSVLEFLGIPYAEPPVGKLRFFPPVRIQSSKGIIKANKKSKSCIQVVACLDLPEEMHEKEMEFIASFKDTSEDCLYLNAWVPSPKPKDAPVMIWIHGGGYEMGSSASSVYDGKILASKGVILVSMNYRLSAFGFLAFDPEEVPGNVGLMDQALAMKWIQENVANFGGDPFKVTIFGESAGASSVAHHLVLPSSQGLFQRAVLQSGAHDNVWSYSDKKTALETAEKLQIALGCNLKHRIDIINCLREKDVNIMREKLNSMRAGLDKILMFNPVVDGYYYPDDPVTMINKGQLNPSINLLMGVSEDDGMFLAMFTTSNIFGKMSEGTFISGDVFLDYIKIAVGTNNDGLAMFIRFLYGDNQKEDLPSTNWRKAVVDFATEYYLMCSTARLADSAAKNGNEVYLYQFNYKSSMSYVPSWSGANHAEELPFVFGLPTLYKDMFRAEEVELSKKMLSYWTEFSKKGNPNSAGFFPWTQYSTSKKSYITLDVTDTIQTGMRPQRCGFFNNVLPKLLGREASNL